MNREQIAEERNRLAREGDDLQMMRRPRLWPNFGVLLMKRVRNGKVETGCLRLGFTLVDEKAVECYVWIPHSTMFEQVPIDDPRVILNPDLQAILDVGWVVD